MNPGMIHNRAFLSLALYALAVSLAYWHPSIAAAGLAGGTLRTSAFWVASLNGFAVLAGVVFPRP